MMKKFPINLLPLTLAAVTLLLVTAFLRYNLYISTTQLAREFQTQNSKELYSIDTLQISTRLNSFSSSLNWVCIQAEARSKTFFKMQKNDCQTGLFQQQALINIPEADGIKISFTLKLSKDLQGLFSLFLILQITSIFSIILATKKSEHLARKKEIELYELSRRMFHDIRSPLASLNEMTEQLEKNQGLEFVILRSSIKRINEIANSLLQKTARATAVEKPDFQNITPLIEEIMQEKKVEHGSKVVFKLKSDSIQSAYIIPLELKRIFSNLLNNAIEASPSSSLIMISIVQIDKKIQIDLQDNGSGIPAHILNKLGLEEVTSKDSGNGIGFKHSVELLKEWQGDLKIISTGSTGTLVRIELLAEEENEKVMQIPNETLPLSRIINPIILVDDDELTRMTWEMKAKKLGINLKTYKDKAIFKCDLNSISKDSILYIDSELGETKGEELAEELHKLGFTNISMASGHPAEHFAQYTFLKSVITKKAPF